MIGSRRTHLIEPVRLVARDLACGYPRRGDVLAGVDLEVAGGSVLALLGPNGSGKTTLLRTLARLLRPRAGVVAFEDQTATGPTGRDIALAAHEDAGGSTLTVAEVVRLGRTTRRGWWRPMTLDDRAVVARALTQANVAHFGPRPVAELSSGEWQRVLLARALAQEPAVLLLDEPTAHLDLRHQVDFLELTARLAHDDGLAVVLSLHDINQAAQWADRIALLAEGRLLAAGPPETVLTAELLERAYDCPVRVDRQSDGTVLVLPRRHRDRRTGAAGPPP